MKQQNKCGRQLVTERYGGGSRYYCPSCDVRLNEYRMPMASWTNANPPQDQRCNKKG